MISAKAFILHLERATGRRANVETLRARLPVESEILAAVDGAAPLGGAGEGGLRALALCAALSVRARPAGNRRISQPSRSLAADRRRRSRLSHASSRTTPRSTRSGSPPFSISWSPSGADGATCSCRPRDWSRPGVDVARAGEFALLRPHSPPLRAIGQIVSHAAAERLLSITSPFDRPVDTFLQMAWVTGVTMLAATPTPDPRRVGRDRRDDGPAQADRRRASACVTRSCGRSIARKSAALYRRHEAAANP